MFLDMLGDFVGNMGLLLSAGFLVGLVHAFEPDHVTAMMTQVRGAGGRKATGLVPAVGSAAVRNSIRGAAWGFGHMSMIFAVSLLVFVLALDIPQVIFDGFEIAVAVMLVALGLSMYGKRNAPAGHSHRHTHENGVVHTHPHTHDNGHRHTHRPYIIGCLHGLAGSGVLVAAGMLMLDDMSSMLLFVLVFGLGSVAGMAAVSGAISIPLQVSRLAGFGRHVRVAAGTIAVVVGVVMIYGVASSGGL